MTDWAPIRTAPVGPTILLAHEPTQTVVSGYGEFVHGRPIWTAVDPTGFGRFAATHWAPMPKFDTC